MSAGVLLLVPLLALGALMCLAAYERRLLGGAPSSGRGSRTPWVLRHDASRGRAGRARGRTPRSGRRLAGRSRPDAPRHRP